MTVVEPRGETVGNPGDEGDPFDVRRACRAPEVLGPFNRAGVLSAADIHVARCLVRLGGDAGEGDGEDRRHAVLLAAALAVRAPRLGHVCSDILTVARTVALDSDLPLDVNALPWPEPSGWIGHLEASALVACGEEDTETMRGDGDGDGDGDGPDGRPLRLVGTRLYLDRYWREERQVAADLLARAEVVAAGVDPAVLGEGLTRLFISPDQGEDAGPDHQRLAAAAAVLRRFSVVAGGPGTGKTTTVARILALLHEQAEAAGAPPPLVALAAPTGKAAARMEEAVHEEAARLDVSNTIRDRLLAVEASTLHRLLGWRPGNRSRFRHHRGNRLPHEVVVVDETSMVSLSLMARLVEAVRPAARLVLVGDPEQLASVEAGAVLGDIVGPATAGLLMRETPRRLLSVATGQQVPATVPPVGAGIGIGDGIVVLRHVHRFGGGIASLAEAVRKGDAEAALDLLGGEREDLTWVPGDIATTGANGPDAVRRAAVQAATSVIEAARAGRARSAIDALGAFRVLCAHRHGPYGVATWMERVERWLSIGVEGFAGESDWYAGRPLLVTENDYGLRLFNGDTGVVVAGNSGRGRLSAVFDRRGELLEFSPTRLAAVDTVYAMTVHKSQGSQFDTVAVLLPDPTSPILTRELLYTAITRARRRLILAGTEEAVRVAVGRPIARNSGLRDRLWGSGETANGRDGRSRGPGAEPAVPPTVRKP
ncbi:MAG TPA: exodeoxyribonuclease V subunit alpha [Acidimicrobiales bacterium]|nr:exodeoxyribonuclease V subunit alpha [Acidimicrobiales bacterium]